MGVVDSWMLSVFKKKKKSIDSWMIFVILYPETRAWTLFSTSVAFRIYSPLC